MSFSLVSRWREGAWLVEVSSIWLMEMRRCCGEKVGRGRRLDRHWLDFTNSFCRAADWEHIMASRSTNPGYVYRSCVAGFSHQHATLVTRLRLRSELVNGDWSSGSRTSRWRGRHGVDFQRSFVTVSGSQLRHDAENRYNPEHYHEGEPTGRRVRRGRRPRNIPEPLDSSIDLIPSPPSKPLGVQPEPTPAPEPPAGQNKELLGGPPGFNWYWESIPPTAHEKVLADRFFTKYGKHARLLQSCAQFRAVVDSEVPEVAFVGRSNVGKSSLLNAIIGAEAKNLIARTSSTRGFTKTMNLYGIGKRNGVMNRKIDGGRHNKIVGKAGVTIVDMPGYGEGSLTAWGVEIMKYIQSRKQLRRVFVLIDAEHGIKDKDRSLLASLRLTGVSHQVILSKMDKLYIPEVKEIKQASGMSWKDQKPRGTVEDLRKAMHQMKADIRPPVGGGALGEVLACSANTRVNGKKLGIDHVRYAILKAVGLEATVKPELQKEFPEEEY